MSFAHKVVLLVMKRRRYFATEQKAELLSLFIVCGKADFRSANLTSEVIFFNGIVRVASSTNAWELTE